LADGEPGQYGGIGADRGAFADPCTRRVRLAPRAVRMIIVRKRCIGPDENIVLHLESVPKLHAAFHRHAISDDDVIFNERVVADDAFAADFGAGQNVGKRPNAAVFTDRRGFDNSERVLKETHSTAMDGLYFL